MGIADAVKRLRTVHADRDGANEVISLWRGMKDMQVSSEFLRQGGTEIAPCSTTTDMSVAVTFSASKHVLLLQLLCRSFITRGADLSFLSAYPEQVEYLYPPLTYLRPTGLVHQQTFGDGDVTITVVQVEPLVA